MDGLNESSRNATGESTDAASPLEITSLVDLSPSVVDAKSATSTATNNTKHCETGKFHVLQRIVSAHPFRKGWLSDACPDETSIETTLEVWKSFAKDEASWMRVAVYSGPDNGCTNLHASFQLPADAHPPSLDAVEAGGNTQCPVLCWPAFPEQPLHPVLCVLVHSTAVCLWDVYPDENSLVTGGDGWTVSLPFDCSGIHAIGDSGGLLLQRLEDVQDYYQQQDDPMGMTTTTALCEDDGFFLKAPPKLARIMSDPGDPAPAAVWTPPPQQPESLFNNATAVSSLFSLQHPLADILPVSQLLTGKDGSINALHPVKPVTDVLEKVLWVGTARWASLTGDANHKTVQQNNQVVMVTYHAVKQRHAVWLIQDAPPPAEVPPLWQRSRQWREAASAEGSAGGGDWNAMRDHDDAADLAADLLGDSPLADPVPPVSVSRTDALAEALGVRRQTPRKAAAVSREIRSHSRNLEPALKQQQQQSSFFSPRTNKSLSTSSALHETMDTVGTAIEPAVGPFSSMHSKTAVTCVFEDDKQTSQAECVFIASNVEASGTLVLSLVFETNGNGGSVSADSKELRLYSLKPTLAPLQGKSHGYTFQVESVNSMSCMAAHPIQATPVPPCFSDHRRSKTGHSELATDILVLTKSPGRSKLSIYRASAPVVDCSLPVDNLQMITDLADPVKDRVGFHWMDSAGSVQKTRGRCTLITSSSALTERALSAIDAALFVESYKTANVALIELALKIRADCLRLAQELSQMAETTPIMTNVSWLAMETVLTALVEQELLGKTSLLDASDIGSKSTDAWSLLLESSFHHSYTLDSADALYLSPAEGSAQVDAWTNMSQNALASIGSLSADYLYKTGLQQIVPCFFDALHLLYEELKLSLGSGEDLYQLASILVRTCRAGKVAAPNDSVADLFMDHYSQDFGDDVFNSFQYVSPQQERMVEDVTFTSSSIAPASFSRWVDGLMQGKATDTYYGAVCTSNINDACATTRSLHRILKVLFTGDSIGRDYNTVIALLEEGFTDASMIREHLPAGIALPILEVLHRCRYAPCTARSSEWPPGAWSLVGRDDLSKNMAGTASRPDCDVTGKGNEKDMVTDKDNDGLVSLERRAAMLFPDDNRIHEAGRLLRSARPIFLRVPRAVEVSDHDYEKQKQSELLLLCRRALALPVGRGMLTLGSLRPVAAEPLPIPELVLKGKIPPTNATLTLDTSHCPSDMTVWPEFHNGVAAGLRLPLEGEDPVSGFKITRTWIVYNKPAPAAHSSNEDGNDTLPAPNQKSHAHGGLLLALGLRGHLTALEMSDLYEYLTQGTVTTTVGVLLGMAANKRGTCDMSVSKMLCLHIPSLIPQHFSAIDVASPVQTAAVTGAGLLFQRSSHRMMTEFLLNEIGKRPDSDMSAFDREAYVLSCGLALGMVNLCLGEKTSDMDRAGGIADLRIEERLYRYVVGGVDDDETRRTRESNDRFSLPSSALAGENEKCSVIFEGDSINTDVTAPGAVLALGLMYMKTGNQTIASAIALPDTHFLLEFVRPDFLGHRVVSRALILWNDVEPTKKWIDAQIPSVVRNACYEMHNAAKNNMEGRSVGPKARKKPDYDRRAVRQIYVHVVAGACMGLGLRFAGTGDKRAADAIFERVLELHNLREANDVISVASRPDFPILETCLGCAAISLAMVLAGTGDLEALKLFKILRWRCDTDIRYGSHAVYGMAIGLLFLGGGTCTLGREPEDIAALVTAFFPRYPRTTSDNQCHLQALRHLYVLAVKRKELCAIDVDTGEKVSVDVDVRAKGLSNPQRLALPCLLLNSDSPWEELRVVSDKYYPVTLSLENIAPAYTFFVKKRSATLNHFPFLSNQKTKAMPAMIQPLTENPLLLAYAKYFCHDDITRPGKDLAAGWGDSRVLLESVSTEESLFLYLTLERAIAAMEQSATSTFALGRNLSDLRLIRTYHQEQSAARMGPTTLSTDASSALLKTDLLAYIHERTERLLAVRLNSSARSSAVVAGVSLYDA
jgi:anaphase-promoting complex subunit 1